MKIDKIAIGIISYERGDKTKTCIESIRNNKEIPYRIFLVDNGSQQLTTKRFFQEWNNSKDIDFFPLKQNNGPSYARNIIIKKTGGNYPIFAMLDNDVLVLEGWDRAAVKAIEEGADLIQPKLLSKNLNMVERGPTTKNPNHLSAIPLPIANNAPRMHESATKRYEVNVVGGTGIYKSEVFKQIGNFDERLFIAEDIDFSIRAISAGYKIVYEPSCELVHDHGFSYDYELERSKVEKYLVAHGIFWQKHQKALLSPAYLKWYLWMYKHNEPMHLPENKKWSIAHRRLRRRLARFIIMKHYPNDWEDSIALEKASKRLDRLIGS